MMRRILPGLLLFTSHANAVDFGTTGDLWPVVEQDMLTLIEQRLRVAVDSGAWGREMSAFKLRVIANSQRPMPVAGISVTQPYEEKFFDPSVRLSADVKDEQGRVFAHAGEIINPLYTVPFAQTLYFIDGDDPRQLDWMRAQRPDTLQYKIILVKGNIPAVSTALDARIYFDQGGVLSEKFGLKTVPVRITAASSGLRLRIESFPPEVQGEAR